MNFNDQMKSVNQHTHVFFIVIEKYSDLGKQGGGYISVNASVLIVILSSGNTQLKKKICLFYAH